MRLLLLALWLLHRHRRLLLLFLLFLLLRRDLFFLGDLSSCDDQADFTLGRFGAFLPLVAGVCWAVFLARSIVVVVRLLLEQVHLERWLNSVLVLLSDHRAIAVRPIVVAL